MVTRTWKFVPNLYLAQLIMQKFDEEVLRYLKKSEAKEEYLG